MATFHLEVKSVKKGRAEELARYDLRLGKWASREDLIGQAHRNLPGWAENDPVAFFAKSDQYERKNGAAARSYIVALPNELGPAENLKLAKEIADHICPDRPWLLAVHGGASQLSGEKNTHMHLMTCDRGRELLGRPAEVYFSRPNPLHPERGGCRKVTGGKSLKEMGHDLRLVRQQVAELQNAALAEAGVSARVDHRTLVEQGVARQPERHFGPGGVKKMTAAQRAQHVQRRSSSAA